jgi:RNA polymerase sigma factor (sigma-70 family)
MPQDGRDRILAALRDAHTLEGLAEEADIVIEAALEDLALKETIFRALGSGSPLPEMLATNTSALSITDIGDSSGHAERVVGLHFFNPAPVMPLVEVVVGDRTASHVVKRAVQFAADLGKQPVVCRDSPGFIVNRVNRPFTLEALRMLDANEADDLTQDVFVRAWEKLSTFRGESAFGTWLHRLAVNVVLARRKTLGVERGRFHAGEDPLEGVSGRRETPEMSMDFEEALANLPDGARQVFVLHDVEGYRHEEIARMLGVVPGTSKSQLHHARMALRRYLDR